MQSQQKAIWQYQWRGMETNKLPAPLFLSISCNVRDLFIATAVKKRLVRIGYFKIKIFVYEFIDIFLWCLTQQPDTNEMRFKNAQF